jgi:hypothetical protein
MNRRKWVAGLSGLFAAAALPLGATRGARAAEKFPLTKAREDWKRLLPAEAFHVLFERERRGPVR